jgi:hypothetical protein
MLLGLVIFLTVVLFLRLCVFLGGSLITWETKKQVPVSRSSVEAELRAMTLVTTEVIWLRWLLEDFGVSVSMPTPLLSDSIGAISIARDPIKHELTKHIGIDAHFTWSQVQDGVVALLYVSSELQLTDFFMKAQTHAQHQFYLSKLSVLDPPCILAISIIVFLHSLHVHVYIQAPGPHINISAIHNKYILAVSTYRCFLATAVSPCPCGRIGKI